jgi:hypothetical protein
VRRRPNVLPQFCRALIAAGADFCRVRRVGNARGFLDKRGGSSRDRRDNPVCRSRYRCDQSPPSCRSHASGTSIGGAGRLDRSIAHAGRSRPLGRLRPRQGRVARYDCRLGRRDHAIESLRLIPLRGRGARISAMAQIASRSSVRLDAPRCSVRRRRNFDGRSSASEHDGRSRGYGGSADLRLAFGEPRGRIPIRSHRPSDRRRTDHWSARITA